MTLRLEITSGERPGLAVRQADGVLLPIHPLWLRERSTQADALDALTRQRLYNPAELPEDLTVAAIEPAGAGRLDIRFSDGHRARYAVAEILAEAAMAPGADGGVTPEPWAGNLAPLPETRWQADLARPALSAITSQFLRLGFVLLRGVPAAPGQVLQVARRFGFVRETNFGALFDVRSVPAASDLAYTALALEPHTDNPYRDPVPGIQLLHCLVNETAGGLSTLVDGLAVAAALRRDDPRAFEILTEVPIRYRYIDAATELVAWAPAIVLDAAGRPTSIHSSSRLDFPPLLSPERLDAWYRARRRFDAMLKSRDFEIRFRLDAGDLVMFDNRRLLDGRTGFDPAEGRRHLQGCYIDIDAVRSLDRVLRREEKS
jgi:gamma-butyrobetaine dioxygenase